MSVAGTWNLDIKTPGGVMASLVELTDTGNGLSGTATGPLENFTLLDPALDGDKLTWTLALTKPVKLKMRFDLKVDGDTLSGTAKAAIFPSSEVKGTRVHT